MRSRIASVLKIVFLFALLTGLLNCQTDSEPETESIGQIDEEIIDFSEQPKIQTVTLNQLNKDPKFNEIKNNFGILKNSALSNSDKDNSYATRLVDSLGITIGPNTIQKIVYDNYVSYTMLMIDPDDTSNNFSNLVIQEKEGVKNIFTARYFPDQQSTAKGDNSASKSAMDSFSGDMLIRSGVRTPNDFVQDGTGGGSSGGNEEGGSGDCDDYITNCYYVGVWVPYGCTCKNHMPWDSCTCNNRAGYTFETKLECYDVCANQNDNDSDDVDNGASNAGTTSGTGSDNNPPSEPDIIIGLVFPDAETQNKVNEFVESLNTEEQAYFYDTDNGPFIATVLTYLSANDFSEEAKKEAKLTIATLSSIVPWTTKTGNYLDRTALAYKATRIIYINGTRLSQHKLTNGDIISSGLYPLCSLCSESEKRTYYLPKGENKWYEYRVPPPNYHDTDLTFLFEAFWTGVKFTTRYMTPLEDAIILIDGKDFDSVEQNKATTAGWMIVGFIPGGKLAKPIIKIGSKVGKFAKLVKVGNKTIKLPINIVNDVVEFGSSGSKLRTVLGITASNFQAHHIIPWAKRGHRAIQKAAKSDKVFHMNEALNGIPMHNDFHLGNHPHYSNLVQQYLDAIPNNLTPDQTFDAISNLIEEIRTAIKNNPTTHINQLSF